MQQINMTQFLLGLAVNLLNLCLPLGLTIYFAIRLAIAHGEVSFNKRKRVSGNKSLQTLREELANE